MKIEPIKPFKPSFTPVEVKFVFESQAELDVLSSLFNHTLVCNTADTITGDDEFSSSIRDTLWKLGGKEIHAKIVAGFEENAAYVLPKPR